MTARWLARNPTPADGIIARTGKGHTNKVISISFLLLAAAAAEKKICRRLGTTFGHFGERKHWLLVSDGIFFAQSSLFAVCESTTRASADDDSLDSWRMTVGAREGVKLNWTARRGKQGFTRPPPDSTKQHGRTGRQFKAKPVKASCYDILLDDEISSVRNLLHAAGWRRWWWRCRGKGDPCHCFRLTSCVPASGMTGWTDFR